MGGKASGTRCKRKGACTHLNTRMNHTAVFISDIHLGSKKAKSKILNSWLKTVNTDSLYLVGDIVDIWRFKQVFTMSHERQASHLEVAERILKTVRKGTRVHYLWGNHDEFMRTFSGHMLFGGISLHERMVHTTRSGKRFLVLHGHQFDFLTKYPATSWMYHAGDWCYEWLLVVNEWYNWCRRLLGMRYWSVSKYIKIKFKRAAQFLESFETVICRYARERGYDGVICGHLHDPKIKTVDGTVYANCGCWTERENCTYIYEDETGELRLHKHEG